VNRIAVAAHEKKADSVYVFFDHVADVAEETAKERETLKRLKVEATRVTEDKTYQQLSNSKQRELYLLDSYGLSKREGVDVIELVKIGEIEVKIVEGESEEAEEEKKKEKKNKK
jgi:hypothetical protein